MVLLGNDAFFAELTDLFQKSRLKGSVTVTIKKYDGRKVPIPREGKPPLPEPQVHYCLMRAVSRNKKIATIIHQKDVTKFQSTYASILKGNMDGLKKLKKTKPKSKAT